MNINVNKSEWEKLASSEQQRITGIISEHFDGAGIVPDDSNKAPAEVYGFCTMACNIAEAAAVAACGSSQTCIIVAQTAGAACRAAC